MLKIIEKMNNLPSNYNKNTRTETGQTSGR